ncbi:MAG: hypothetical protein H8E51_08595 [Bacteroidetes bacterium]|nr:hypothetical protein [Bacteroidota bacterium]
MIFKLDAEADAILTELLDMALKAGGMSNRELVNSIMAVKEVVPDEPKKKILLKSENPEKK